LNELLLYDLFEAVRKDKRLTPIGTQQYFFLLELLKNGYNINSYQQLLFVCEALWLKSKEQQPFIREIFNAFKDRIETAFTEAVKKENTGDGASQTVSATDAVKPETVSDASTTQPASTTSTTTTTETTKPATQQTKDTKKDSTGLNSGEMRFSLGSGDSTQTLNIKLSEGKERESLLSIPYLFNDDYFPLNNRQLSQYWRNLTSRNAGAEIFEVDFPATIQRIGKQGFLYRLLYNRELQNQLSLIIFLDQGGSMQCYEEYGKELVKSALESKVHPALQSAFFYNLPIKNKRGHYQLSNADQTLAYKTDVLFREKNKKDNNNMAPCLVCLLDTIISLTSNF